MFAGADDRHDQVIPLAPPKEAKLTQTRTVRKAAKVASPD